MFGKRLQQAATQLPLVLTDKQCQLMARHWQLVKEASAKFNLTAIRDDEEALNKHYLDCLLAAEFVPQEARALDIGSGAGYPGIPLAIACPSSTWTLLDSLQKRCQFLAQVQQELTLNNIEILCQRAETAAQEQSWREQFDLVVARAVTQLPVLLEYALPFLQPGGLLIAMKGPALAEELSLADNALSVLGGTVERIEERLLKTDGSVRYLALIRKTEKSPLKYPRRAGMPEKRPL